MTLDPALRDLVLILSGFVIAEISALIKSRRDRKDRVDDQKREDELRTEGRDLARRQGLIQTCGDVLAESHSIMIHVEGARANANAAVNRLRLTAPPDLAMAASKHYVAASTGTNQEYQVSQVHFINAAREHLGEDAIQEFVEYMDGTIIVEAD